MRYYLFLSSLDIPGCLFGVCKVVRCGVEFFPHPFPSRTVPPFEYSQALCSTSPLDEDRESNLFGGSKQGGLLSSSFFLPRVPIRPPLPDVC